MYTKHQSKILISVTQSKITRHSKKHNEKEKKKYRNQPRANIL